MDYIVIGRHRVAGKAKGEIVALPQKQGERLTVSGHVEPAPKPKDPPKDKPAGGGEGVKNDA